MHRFFYTLLLYLLLPFVPLKLLWRGIQQPEYLKHWGERFGFYASLPTTSKPMICLHCVSVGETRAVAPLIQALRTHYPNHQILLTHATPTGRETGHQLFGDSVMRVYLPYDVPFAVRRFLRHFQPKILLLMETEIWFNLLAECKKNAVPCLLINARLSEKSARGYQKLGPLFKEGLLNLSQIAAQTSFDAQRFQLLGAHDLPVTGNLKFEFNVPEGIKQQGQNFRQLLGEQAFVFVAASTRDGEEALLLNALQAIHIPHLITIIVPRHPQRFEEVESLFQSRGLNYAKRSLITAPLATNTRFVLGDSMGELLLYYAASDVAFVGGSLLPFGGQNLIEPCALGKPVFIGPHVFNFELAAANAIKIGAAMKVENATDLMQQLQSLAATPALRNKMGEAGLKFVSENQGATKKTLDIMHQYLQ
jgi:3-deoxy-D-manno-octulosonic-acid transferase